MAYPQHIKELAYTIDPECWVSYSGKPREFKSYMDVRRTASLQKAEDDFARHERRQHHQHCVSNSDIAAALRSADWSHTSIGNKMLIQAAIERLDA